MNIYEFDKVFFNKFNKKYNSHEEVPSHIKFYENKINSIKKQPNNICNIFWETELLIINTILKTFKTKKILEIGAGIGQLSIFLKHSGIDVEACEICNDRAIDFMYFCKEFETNVKLYQEPYQLLNLDKYDVLVGVGIGNTVNNLNKDINLLENLNNNKKIIYIEPFGYEDNTMDISQDKKHFYKFLLEMQYNFFSSL